MIFDKEKAAAAQPAKIVNLSGYRKVDLNTFKEGELLGRGASGEVYKAMVAGHFFAVKKVNLGSLVEVAGDEKQRLAGEVEALRSEIELLKKLDHPRIVRYVGSLLQNPDLLIFLEYMPCGSMSTVLRKFGPYEIQLARKYTRQVLEGLVFLHARGIVHRDLKGANILIDQWGDAKLADFGACRQLASLHATLSGEMKSIKGSVYWMAPEMVAGTIGRRCDIWSAGCTTIEMMLGAHPWSLHPKAGDWGIADAISYIIGSQEIPPFPPNADEQCVDYLRDCLKREHRDRPYAEQLLRHPFILD